MKKIFLVDASSLFFRAYYAIRPLSSPTGVPVNAIYGFLSMIVKLLKEEKPEYLAFCYDRKEPSFRKEIDDNYKANRGEMPEDLIPQIPYIKKLADLLGIPSFEKDRFEADDLIGTLAHFGIKNKLDVVIVSGDKDFAQIIGPGIIMYDTMKGVRYDEAGVVEKWGVRPDQFIDYLALVGDSSDNIPGVSGIGPKGAQKLLSDYGSLDGVYAHLDDLSAKLAEKLKNNKDNAYLSQKLVTIVNDVPLDIKLEDLHIRPIHTQELKTLLQELNFKAMAKSLLGEDAVEEAEKNSSPIENDKLTAESESYVGSNFSEKSMDCKELKKWLKSGDSVWALSTERFNLLSKENEIIILQGDPEELGAILSEKKLSWSGFDLKSFWRNFYVQSPQISWDSELAAYVLKAGDSSDFAKVYESQLAETLPTLPSPTQWLQAHLKLAAHLQIKLKENNLDKIYKELDLPASPVLLKMEQHGFRIDTDQLAVQSKELSKDLNKIEKEIHSEVGEVFNIASPKQIAHILFEKMQMPPGKKTKTGYSTDNEVLEKLAPEYPIVRKILEYRELAKLKSTYVDALPQLVNPKTGRVHSTFRQAFTSTGRLSSINPNLQNIPIRTERGARVRKAFIADPGQVLLSVDYSQIELRILAHFAKDEALCKAFEKNLDIHTATASEVFEVSLDKVTADLRRAAKAVNFGIAYGQGVYGLAENLNIPRAEASNIIKRYFERFPGVKTYMEEIVKEAYEKGYVETLIGRRRYIDELKAKNNAVKKFGERAAINAPIQGTASDLVKKAMIEVAKQVPLTLLLQVHDELIFEGTEDEVQKYKPQVKQIMEQVAQLRVPLKVNMSVGPNWDEAH